MSAPPLPETRTIGTGEFVALMAMLMALQALSIDAMLPALGQIAGDLGVTDPNRRQLVVGLYLIASGFGCLIPGALADRFGRRPVLFGALAVYMVLVLACATVQDFTTLLVLRVVQAAGSAGLSVLPFAIVRDRMAGDQMARMQSTISVVFLLVPALAPSLGQVVLLFASWRWIFVVMAGFALVVGVWAVLRLPETLDPANRQPVRPRAIAANMVLTATTRSSIGYVLGSALVFGSLFGYINSSQQLVGEHFGAADVFPLLFGATALAMGLASFINARIVERFGARRISHGAVFGFIAVSALQVWGAFQPHQSLWLFMPLMGANMMLLGFIGANFGAIALQPFGRIAGAASSVQVFLRMAVGSAIGAVIGQAYDGTARPLAIGLLTCSIASLALVLWSEQGRLFRRVLPPGADRPVPDNPIR